MADEILRRQIPEVGGFFPGAGAGGGLNVDFSGGAGAGLGGLGLLGGGLPGWGGWAGPYVPVTPLGALGGIKGDLIVPIVAVGVALFLLVLIVLAVKAALAWKLSVLEDLAGPRRFSREAGSAAAPQLEDGYLDQLAKIVSTAIYSGSCSDRMICEAGAFARGNAQTVNGIIALVDSYVPPTYHSYLDILKSSAEGSFDCAQKYQCGQQNQQQQQQGQPGNLNKFNAASSAVNPQQQQAQALFNGQQQSTPRPQLNEVFLNATTTPRPLQQKFGKFRRHID